MGGGQRCVGEGWEEVSPGHKAPAKRSLQIGAFRAKGGRGYALRAGVLGRMAPGCVLCLGHKGAVSRRSKPKRSHQELELTL